MLFVYFREHGETGTQNQATGTTCSSVEPHATSKHPISSQLHSPFRGNLNTTNQPQPPPVSFKRTSSPAAKYEQTDRKMKTGNNTVEVDMLAEFESWLESGAVDIV
jgi:ATP-dependent DNA helicase HFM1/MER3